MIMDSSFDESSRLRLLRSPHWPRPHDGGAGLLPPPPAATLRSAAAVFGAESSEGLDRHPPFDQLVTFHMFAWRAVRFMHRVLPSMCHASNLFRRFVAFLCSHGDERAGSSMSKQTFPLQSRKGRFGSVQVSSHLPSNREEMKKYIPTTSNALPACNRARESVLTLLPRGSTHRGTARSKGV